MALGEATSNESGYRIRDWDLEYEVNSHNGVWEPGQTKRKRGLDYVRLKVRGRNVSRTFLAMTIRYGDEALMAVGLFNCLLSMTAAEDCGLRGFVVDRKGFMTPAAIARTLNVSEKAVLRCLSILMDPEIEWVEVVSSEEVSRSSGNSRNSLQEKGIEGKTKEGKSTERKGREDKVPESLPPSDSADLTPLEESEGSQVQLRNQRSGRKEASEGTGGEAPEGTGSQGADEGLSASNGKRKRSLADDITEFTGEVDWHGWWRTVLGRLKKANAEAYWDLRDAVKDAVERTDPVKRAAKGLGVSHENPASYLVSEAIALMKANRLRWPDFPEKVGKRKQRVA